MMTTVKTVLGADIRRFTLDPSTLTAGTSLFAHVSTIVNDSYDLRGARIALSYFDDENDQCAVSGDDEMREAFRFAHAHQSKLLKLHVALVDGPAPTVARVPSSAPAGATTEAKATAAPSPAPAPAAAAAPTTAAAEVAEVKEVAPPPPPQPSAEFVADLAIPDGEVHPAGSTITKAWSVKNNGKAAWPFGSTLSFKEGSLTPSGTVVLPQLASGETGAIRVQCNVPSQAGRHRSEWVLTAPDGKVFDGDASMWAEVVVRSPFSAEFVLDLTIPDGTVVLPNATMRKAWRVRNDGTETWKDCLLVYTAGSGSIVPSQFDTSAVTISSATESKDAKESKEAKEAKEDKAPPRIAVPVPTCRADESIDVSVLMQLPAQSGVARGEWLLCRADGTPFDHDAALWANVQVIPAPLTKEEMLAQLPAFLTDGELRATLEKLLAAAKARADVVVHEGIHCDGCGMAPITGLRFKCTSCDDYDLCEACEAAGNKHPREHVLIKAKRPLSRTPSSAPATAASAPTAAATAPPPPSLVRGSSTGASGRASASSDWRAPAKKIEAKSVTTAATASPTKRGKAPKAAGAPRAQFVSDLSLQDGCVVAAGSVVTKRWAIKNVGSAAWPAGVKLMYVGGELQPAAADPTPALSVVPTAPAGATIECSARVQVPRECGRYTGYYRLATHDDKRFGHRMWLDVLVDGAAPAPATAAPATSATASSAPAAAPAPASSSSSSSSAAVTAAATPAPATAAAAPATVATQFAEELGRLRAMGFRDDDMLRELLVAAGGKVQQVIDWLVNPVV